MKNTDGVFTDDYGRTEKQIYNDLLEGNKMPDDFDVFKDDEEKNDNSLFFDFHFLEDDANELLAEFGLDQNFDISNYPKEQLKRIFKFYFPRQSEIVNGKEELVDPLGDYKAGNDSFEEEMFKIGYKLGKAGTLGIYFRLLPHFQFRRGYWVGKMERSIELNDDDVLRDLSREIKIYDATQANEELGYIVNNIFKEEKAPKMSM